MRIKSSNRYVVRFLAWLFRLPVRKVKFIFIDENCDPDLTDLAYYNGIKERFGERSDEFKAQVDEAIKESS